MNKVSSIEIAGQVFWINDSAYTRLQQYLTQIRQQLAKEESADEIFMDIELRIAELLYSLNTSENKAISESQLINVIEQVGFLDTNEPDEHDQTQPRKSYRDTKNRLLGGVCAGLAIRLSVPAIILRLVFVALAALFGFGVILYLIFWISLDSISSRNATLAAHGKAQTAKSIATFEAPNENPLLKMQRIIFLPISIIGTLLHVVISHFKNRRTGYALIAKNALAVLLLFLTFIACLLLFDFNQKRFFNTPFTWLISAAVVYLMMLGLSIYFREFYLPKPRKKVDKKLKMGAGIPVLVVAVATWSINMQQSTEHTEVTQRSFSVSDKSLHVALADLDESSSANNEVNLLIIPSTSGIQEVGLEITYSAYGKDKLQAEQNIEAIDYFYSIEKNVLTLSRFWSLKEGRYKRSQRVDVILTVPDSMQVITSFPLKVESQGQFYTYPATLHNDHYVGEASYSYLAINGFIHELGQEARIKLSANERAILNEKFCQEFFISESWACRDNIQLATNQNKRFDKAFEPDSELIDAIRINLQPDRSLFMTQLQQIRNSLEKLTIKYPVKSEFHQYIDHLIQLKSDDAVQTTSNAG